MALEPVDGFAESRLLACFDRRDGNITTTRKAVSATWVIHLFVARMIPTVTQRLVRALLALFWPLSTQ